jgi:hypothetical protein
VDLLALILRLGPPQNHKRELAWSLAPNNTIAAAYHLFHIYLPESYYFCVFRLLTNH